LKNAHSGVFQFPLKLADIGAINPSFDGQCLLGKALLHPYSPNIARYNPTGIHAGNRTIC
jgi:hypothetical protein